MIKQMRVEIGNKIPTDVEFIKWLLEKNGETLEEHLDESN